MKASRPSIHGDPPPEDRKTRDRRAKQQKRAALYAQGLTATGEPLKNPSMSRRLRDAHPPGCPCYDCLFPEG